MKREAILAGFVPRKAGRPRKKQLEEEELPKPVAEPKPVEPQPKPLPEPERVTEPTCIESGIQAAPPQNSERPLLHCKNCCNAISYEEYDLAMAAEAAEQKYEGALTQVMQLRVVNQRLREENRTLFRQVHGYEPKPSKHSQRIWN